MVSPAPAYYAPQGPQGPPSAAQGGAGESATVPSLVPPGVALCALIANLVALGAAWYSISLTVFILRAGIDFSLFGCSFTMFGIGVSCDTFGVGGAFGPVQAAMRPSMVLVILAMVVLLATSVLLFARKVTPKLGGALLLFGGVMLTAAPLLMMAAIQGAFSQAPFLQPDLIPGVTVGADGPWNSFMGSTNWANVPVSWGPGAGWYASFVAGAIALLAGFMSVSGKPGPTAVRPPAAAQAYAPVYGQVYPYGQPAYNPYAQGASAPQPGYYAPGGAVAVPGTYVAAPAPPTKNCASCGTLNWAASVTCGSCGAPMGR